MEFEVCYCLAQQQYHHHHHVMNDCVICNIYRISFVCLEINKNCIRIMVYVMMMVGEGCCLITAAAASMMKKEINNNIYIMVYVMVAVIKIEINKNYIYFM